MEMDYNEIRVKIAKLYTTLGLEKTQDQSDFLSLWYNRTANTDKHRDYYPWAACMQQCNEWYADWLKNGHKWERK